MNILLVAGELPPSLRSAGIGTYINELAINLNKISHKVVIIAPNDNIFKNYQINRDGVDIYFLSGGDFYVGRTFFARVLNRIYKKLNFDSFRMKVSRKIKELDSIYNFDVVEIQEYDNLGKFWLKERTIPSVIRFHGPSSLDRADSKIRIRTKKQLAELEILSDSDRHSFVSKGLRDTIFDSEYFPKNSVPNEVIHNSVQTEREPIFDNLKASSYATEIIGAGTIGMAKGWDRLVEAVKKLNEDGHNINLTLYGREADLSKKLESFANSLPANNKWLKIRKPISKDILIKKFFTADISIFPSLYETFSMIYLEAMSVGGLVIAGSDGGGKELINDGKNGFLLSSKESTHKFAEKIKKIINLDEREKIQIRKEAFNTVKNNFSYSEFLDKQINCYKKAKKTFLDQGLK